MTLDSNPDSTSSTSTTSADASTDTPARKPPRRRATRSAAPPQAPVEPSAPEGAAAPTERVVAAGPAEPSSPTTVAASDDAPAAPAARRSRRSTRATGGAAAAKQQPTSDGTTTPAGGDPVLDVLSEFGIRETATDAGQKPAVTPEVALDADTILAGKQTARRSRSRASAAKAPSDAPTAAEAQPVAAEADAVPDAPKKTRARRAPRRAVAEAPAEPAAEPTSDAGVEPAAVTEPTDLAAGNAVEETTDAPATKPAKKKPARRATKKSAAVETAEPAGEPAPAEQPAPAQKPAGAEPSGEADRPARSRATARTRTSDDAARTPDAPAVGTPRLATTALLFQAPDPARAPRRPRRAQSPAGPPRHVEPAVEESPAPTGGTTRSDTTRSTSTTAASAASVPATEQGAPTTGRGSRRSRGNRAPAPEVATTAVVDTAETAESAATAGIAETVDAAATLDTVDTAPLTGADLAAAQEVELIESELAAEGVELPELEPQTEGLEPLDEAEGTPDDDEAPRRRRRRGGRGRRGRAGESREATDTADESEAGAVEDGGEPAAAVDGTAPEDGDGTTDADAGAAEDDDEGSSSRRRRRRRRGGRGESAEAPSTRGRPRERSLADEVTALKGSTRLEAKRQRRREGRDAGRRRQIISEAEFLARRESVERSMVVREQDGRTQIAVLEDGVLVEHYVSQQSQASMAGNVYLGRVQNVLPSMEAAFVDVGKGRNAVLYAGEVNWDAAGLDGQPRRIEQALKSGDPVLVQVTKDPIGHKGARLTAQITLAGRYLVFVPGGGMTGISRKLPDTERNRLKKILKEVVPDGAGVIVRTAAEGASEDELRADVERLRGQWEQIEKKSKSASAPALLQGEPDLAIRVVRDIFNDDFSSLVVQGEGAWSEISSYVEELAPDLRERVSRWTGDPEATDVFTVHRVDEQLSKGMDRKVWLPSGGSLVIDRTEAMTVVDVNTGKFTGSGGTLEETVTRNNLEAAEEIVRQLRLRDIGGIIVIDFIDMVLESNRDLVLRRLVECLGRDRTKHQVAEVTSLGLVQMTRKRVGQGLVEAFSSTCEHCHGRGFVVHTDPVERNGGNGQSHGSGSSAPGEDPADGARRSRRKRGGATATKEVAPHAPVPVLPEVTSEARAAVKATLATIAAAAAHAHEHGDEHEHAHEHVQDEHAQDEHAQDETVAAVDVVTADVASVEDAPVEDAPESEA
ncbi:Rne/Rng family ribonuclease [Cellulosimicrobium terreum]|nr:Rne/Rng family ribonuclease [Cellulosimicrobium terreum]